MDDDIIFKRYFSRRFPVADPRISKFADILVQHSARVVPGDRILIEATTAAEPLVRELYIKILEKGGHPVPLLQLPDMFFPGHEDLLIMKGNNAQLDFVPPFQKLAYDNFESRIRIHSSTNTRSQTKMDSTKSQRRGKATSVITAAQMQRTARTERPHHIAREIEAKIRAQLLVKTAPVLQETAEVED